MATSRIIQANKSVTRLLLDTEEKGKNIMSIRTFSPSIQKISSKLCEKRREKNIIKKQQQMLDRLESVLEEYKRQLVVCRGEKENLKKDNKKLKEKLASYCSA